MKESARLPLKASRIAVRGRCGVLTTCLVLAQILAVGTAARAQIVFEQKITASGATSNNSFGTSVAISGHATIVGAPYAAVFSSGSAYLFDVTTGNQLFKLTAADSVEQDQFGNSVGISGNTAIVGAVLDDEERSVARSPR